MASALVLAGCFAESRTEASAFVGFFVSCPIWLHVAEFNVTAWAVGLGLCLATTAIVLLDRGRFSASVAAAVATAVALGIHQSLFAFIVCGSLSSASLRLFETDPGRTALVTRVLYRIAPLALSWSLAVLLYYGTTSLVLLFSNQHLRYVESFLHLREFTAGATYQPAVGRPLERLCLLVIGADGTFLRWRWGVASILLAWIGAVAATARTLRAAQERWRPAAAGSLLMIGSALAALGPLIVSAGLAPLRTLPGLSLLYAMGAAFALRHTIFGRTPQWLIFYFALFINSWISATLFNADAIARDRDRSRPGDSYPARGADQRGDSRAPAQSAAPSSPGRPVGARDRWPSGTSRGVRCSFFDYDGGRPDRVANYLRLLGVDVSIPQVRLRGEATYRRLTRFRAGRHPARWPCSAICWSSNWGPCHVGNART